MDLEIVRRIRENVHGTVDVTALEDRVIAHPYFQRLRRIRQLAFLSFVFPGATHSRFEHSLGVMQLAGHTWGKLRANQIRLSRSLARYRDFDVLEKQPAAGGLVHGLLAPTFPLLDDIFGEVYTEQALRLGGLLHDVGHPAFSHSGERFLPTWDAVVKAQEGPGGAPAYVREFLEAKRDSLKAKGRDPAKVTVRHEVYTLLLVERMMTELAQTTVRGEIPVSARDVLAVMTPEIKPDRGSPLEKHGVSRLCHELISGEVDIDRMDYLLRDSRECGVVYGIFDATRIQDSLAIYFDPSDEGGKGGLHLAISYSGLAAFEDYLRARHSMYLQLYFHKTSVSAEAMMQHLSSLLGGWTLPSDVEGYAELDEYNIEGALTDAARALATRSEQRHFAQLLRDLLRTRKLWKRAFEVVAKDEAEGRHHQGLTDRACTALSVAGIPFEQISSSSSLTTFRERQGGEHSRNYLRLIKKDETQFPRVCPIEDHTDLIAANRKVAIRRIYVPEDAFSSARQLIASELGGHHGP